MKNPASPKPISPAKPVEKVAKFGQGQEIFRQGEKGGDLYFVQEGQVELTVHNEETGDSAVVAVVGPRSILGTMTFLDMDRRSATAKAVTDVECIIVSGTQREKILESVPAWFAILVKDMSANLRKLNLEHAKLSNEIARLQKRLATKAAS